MSRFGEDGYVVIHPDDGLAVRRLVEAFWASTPEVDDGNDQASMARALRKIAGEAGVGEPAGLGAVVEDLDGRLWVKVASDKWHGTTDGLSWGVQPWSRITAYRLLTCGVRA